MTDFFDPGNLTATQKLRWDYAISEYARVQESNLDARIASLSPEEQASELDRIQSSTGTRPSSYRDYLKDISLRNAKGAGNPKSALFWRLLNGKEALASPPPHSFSCPWYEVIEEAGPHPVEISVHQSDLALVSSGARDARGLFQLSLNQCSWSVLDLNEAARDLLRLQTVVVTSRVQLDDGYAHLSCNWSEPALDAVLQAYAKGPEFIVRHGNWPAYRLRLGRNKFKAELGNLRLLQGPKGRDSLRLRMSNSDLFDLSVMCIDARLERVLAKGIDPRKRFEETQEALADWTAKYPDTPYRGLQTSVDYQRRIVARYEADPDSFQIVEASSVGWILEKDESLSTAPSPATLMLAVYENPADFPGSFVARLHVAQPGEVFPTPNFYVGRTLEEVRQAIPGGMFRIDRMPEDDPNIVETWI